MVRHRRIRLQTQSPKQNELQRTGDTTGPSVATPINSGAVSVLTSNLRALISDSIVVRRKRTIAPIRLHGTPSLSLRNKPPPRRSSAGRQCSFTLSRIALFRELAATNLRHQPRIRMVLVTASASLPAIGLLPPPARPLHSSTPPSATCNTSFRVLTHNIRLTGAPQALHSNKLSPYRTARQLLPFRPALCGIEPRIQMRWRPRSFARKTQIHADRGGLTVHRHVVGYRRHQPVGAR